MDTSMDNRIDDRIDSRVEDRLDDFFADPIFDECREIEVEEEQFLKQPLNVDEGIHTCIRCGSRKTLSYCIQTRSCDEPTTVVVACVQCKAQWRL